MKSYVYAIGPDHGFPIKVGVATKPFVRLANLQCCHWEELVIHGLFSVNSKAKAYRLEKICHKRLGDRSIRGEWFNIFAGDAVEILSELVKEMGGRRVKNYGQLLDSTEFIEKLDNMGCA